MSLESSIPAAGGVYALVFHLERPLSFEAGRLGRVQLPPGVAVYVGSALGPGGVLARLQRHLRPAKRLHWHVDYLTALLPPVSWQYALGPERRECLWSRRLAAQPGAAVPAPGFGSSDCRRGCAAHLYHFPFASPPDFAFISQTYPTPAEGYVSTADFADFADGND